MGSTQTNALLPAMHGREFGYVPIKGILLLVRRAPDRSRLGGLDSDVILKR
jgi:hypothetical protein